MGVREQTQAGGLLETNVGTKCGGGCGDEEAEPGTQARPVNSEGGRAEAEVAPRDSLDFSTCWSPAIHTRGSDGRTVGLLSLQFIVLFPQWNPGEGCILLSG